MQLEHKCSCLQTHNYNVGARCNTVYIFSHVQLLVIYNNALHLYTGFGKVDETQIQAIASKPDYALIKPSADELEPLSNEILRYTCEGKCRIVTFATALHLLIGRRMYSGIQL